MQKIKILFPIVLINLVTIINLHAQVSNFTEGFETVLPSGWVAINKSTPANTSITWAQGNNANFDSYDGSSNAYAASSYECIPDNPGVGTISNWILTPVLSLSNNATLKFYTRKATPDPFDFPDRLEVRLSKNGSSTNVGSDATGVGDFTSLYASINQTLAEGGYPYEWKEYTIVLSGISAGQTGRIAFRHFVTDAGINGANSDYIGIDNVRYDNLLPVHLVNFSAALQNNKPLLQWSVTNEQQMIGYDIERSIDGKTFTKIGFVSGKGTTVQKQAYSYTDFNVNQLNKNKVYYRLRQVDFDGHSDYSKTISLSISKIINWVVTPNPVSAQTAVRLSLEKASQMQIQVINNAGMIVQSINKGLTQPGDYTIPLEMQNVASGVYMIRLILDDNISTQKIVK